jgi:LysR family transcriptional regulator, glycine cleavage system transcriptional activator
MSNRIPRDVPIGQLPPMSNLLAFESVARNQSLARAASELGVTKSALTHSIAHLEFRLKLRLVYKYSPLVVLTPVGQAYFASSQAFTRQLRDDHYKKSTTATTQIRVSCSRGLARLWLGPRLSDFHRLHPRIELIISAVDRLESVLGDGVDVGLRYGGPALPNMQSMLMWEDRHVAVGNPFLAKRARFMNLEEILSSLPLVQHSSIEWSGWAQGLVSPELLIRPKIITSDLHFCLECAARGLGVAIVPRRLAQGYVNRGQLEVVTSHSVPSKPYHAVFSKEQSQREPMKEFLGWIQRQVEYDSALMS